MRQPGSIPTRARSSGCWGWRRGSGRTSPRPNRSSRHWQIEAPADAWLRNQLALVLVEQTDESKRRRALDLAELSVRQNPKAADSLATLGTVYYRLGRLDEAEKALQAVVNSGKGDSDAVYMLAHVKTDRGNTDAAQPLLKMALTHGESSSSARMPRNGSIA